MEGRPTSCCTETRISIISFTQNQHCHQFAQPFKLRATYLLSLRSVYPMLKCHYPWCTVYAKVPSCLTNQPLWITPTPDCSFVATRRGELHVKKRGYVVRFFFPIPLALHFLWISHMQELFLVLA